MTAVFRREVGSYFKGVLGYLLAAFLLVFAGIYCMAYNLSGYYANFEYVLSAASALSILSPFPSFPCGRWRKKSVRKRISCFTPCPSG